MNRGQISTPDGRIDPEKVPTGELLPIGVEVQVRHWNARTRADEVIYKGPLDPYVIAKLAGIEGLEE